MFPLYLCIGCYFHFAVCPVPPPPLTAPLPHHLPCPTLTQHAFRACREHAVINVVVVGNGVCGSMAL